MPISIIIPSTGNRTDILLDTLNSTLDAVKDLDAEVIVIKKKEKIIKINHPRLRIIDVTFNNVSASRNLGAQVAVNDLLFFIDDDIVVSVENIKRIVSISDELNQAYLITTIWKHSDHVNRLKSDTFLGQMMEMYYPKDSFKTRYMKVSNGEWCDNELFKSSITNAFWEFGFAIRRADYLRIGGMNEQFNFGDEGIDFLKRALSEGVTYFVDAGNLVVHNEWDKFNDWAIPENRWRVEAQLVNEGKRTLGNRYKNYIYKIIYGVMIYLFSPILRAVLYKQRVRTVERIYPYFKLFDIYMTSLYWNQINWRTLNRQ